MEFITGTYCNVSVILCDFFAVDGDWETHHDQLAYVGYEVGYQDDDFDELELQEVFHP